MFSDPLLRKSAWTVLTEAAPEWSLACVERAADHSLYRHVDATSGTVYDLFIGHQYGRRSRYTARFTVSGLTPDLLIDAQNSKYSQSVYVVVDVPISGPIAGDYTTGDEAIADMLRFIGRLCIATTDNSDMLRVVHGET